MDNKIELEVMGLQISRSQTGAYALILGEVNGNRRLPVIIGYSEAQAIVIKLENIKPSRPLTHDLIKSFLDEYKIVVKEVMIEDIKEGIFYSSLVCVKSKKTVKIDARTSDAVAIAVRVGCKIYTTEEVLNTAGLNFEALVEQQQEEQAKEGVEDKTDELESLSIEELEDLLNKAIEEEEFEKASKIRDEIKHRKNS